MSERNAVEIVYFSSTIGLDLKNESVAKRLIPIMDKLKEIKLDDNDTCVLLRSLFNFNKFKTEDSRELHQFFKPHFERMCLARNKILIESIAPIAFMLRMQGLIKDEIYSCFESTQHDLVVSSKERKVLEQLQGIQRVHPDKIIIYDQSRIHCKFETVLKHPERNKIIIIPQCEMYPKSELVVDFLILVPNQETEIYDQHRLEIDGKHHYRVDPYIRKTELRLWDQRVEEFLGPKIKTHRIKNEKVDTFISATDSFEKLVEFLAT